MEVEEILAKLVSFNTVRDAENDQLFAFLREYLAPFGFTFKEVGGNLVAERGKNTRISFLGHVDVVPQGDNWSTDPFKLTKRGDKLFGRGTADMKGGLAAILFAAAQTKIPVKLFFTYDEEIGFSGIKELVASGEKFPKLMIVAEPTEEIPLTAGKGLLEYCIKFRGQRAHSSNPDAGQNAIYAAAEFIEQLRKFADDLRQIKDSRFAIPFTTMNIGQISGGDSINSVAESCELVIDFRTISPKSTDKCRSEVAKLCVKFNAKPETINDIAPFSNEISNLKILGDKFGAADYLTEASFLNVPRIILGPGPNTSHNTNEYISLKSLKNTAKTYQKLMES